MKNGLLQSVVAATSMSLMTTVNAQENSTLDIGRFRYCRLWRCDLYQPIEHER